MERARVLSETGRDDCEGMAMYRVAGSALACNRLIVIRQQPMIAIIVLIRMSLSTRDDREALLRKLIQLYQGVLLFSPEMDSHY